MCRLALFSASTFRESWLNVTRQFVTNGLQAVRNEQLVVYRRNKKVVRKINFVSLLPFIQVQPEAVESSFLVLKTLSVFRS